MTVKIKRSKLPEFKSIEEQARFWETHDVVDFIDELTPVRMKYKVPPTETIKP